MKKEDKELLEKKKLIAKKLKAEEKLLKEKSKKPVIKKSDAQKAEVQKAGVKKVGAKKEISSDSKADDKKLSVKEESKAADKKLDIKKDEVSKEVSKKEASLKEVAKKLGEEDFGTNWDKSEVLDIKTKKAKIKAAKKAAKNAAKAEKAKRALDDIKAVIADNPDGIKNSGKDTKLTQIIRIIKSPRANSAKIKAENDEYRALQKSHSKLKLNWKHDHKKIWFDSMIGMTWGFIASLIVGTVIGLFGMYSNDNIFVSIKHAMSFATPAAIGVGIAYKAKLSPLQILAIAIGVFIIGHSSIIPVCHDRDFQWLVSVPNGESTSSMAAHFQLGLPGDVFGAWIGSVMFVYLFKVFEWKTFIDLYLIPILAVFLGLVGSYFLTYLTSSVLVIVEWVINNTVMTSWGLAIILAPIIGVLMGFALSLPTSSAAIAFALSLHGHAAVAAMAGTAGQMISFGVITYLATGSVSKSFAVGFGTSMLQMNNFIKRPRILLIPGFVSGITALLAVLMFKDLSYPLHWGASGPVGSVTSGMGTAMFYGQIFTLKENGWSNYLGYLNVIFVQLLIPALLGLGLGALAFKKGFLKKEWLEISYA